LKLSLVLAQCVMCYRTAAQQGARSQVLNKGIVILLIPPVVIWGDFAAGVVNWFVSQGFSERQKRLTS